MSPDGPVDLLDDGLLRIEQSGLEPPSAPVAPEPTARPTCERCADRPSVHRCFQCERWVCHDDVWTMLGLCKDCAKPDPAAGSAKASWDLGIKWVED